MIHAGIATKEEGAAALKTVRQMPDAVRPRTPYLYHYVVDAMIECGMKEKALDLIRSYWGGMVNAGADTFWEVYDPAEPELSPYKSLLVNSHAVLFPARARADLRSRRFAQSVAIREHENCCTEYHDPQNHDEVCGAAAISPLAEDEGGQVTQQHQQDHVNRPTGEGILRA